MGNIPGIYYLLIPNLIILCTYVWAEITEKRLATIILKPLCSLFFIGVAYTCYNHSNEKFLIYGQLILLGHLFSFIGDVILLNKNRKAFLFGLTSFACAHILYIIAFIHPSKPQFIFVPIMALVSFAAYTVYFKIHKSLGRLKFPVIVYMMIISAMLSTAIYTLVMPGFNTMQSVLIIIGALFFYISDIMLAIVIFVKPFLYNRVGLFFYYTGQILISLSIAPLLLQN